MAMVIETVADVGVVDAREQGEHGLLMGRQSIEDGQCYDPCRLRRVLLRGGDGLRLIAGDVDGQSPQPIGFSPPYGYIACHS